MKTVFSICLFFLLMTSTAFAMSVEDFENIYELYEIEDFQITNGSLHESASTFEEIKTLSGRAPRDTIVEISILVPDEYDETLLVEEDFFELSIGSSGIFTQIVNLSVGENYILIYAHNDGDITIMKTVINRKDDEIKQELSRGLAFPGRSAFNRRS